MPPRVSHNEQTHYLHDDLGQFWVIVQDGEALKRLTSAWNGAIVFILKTQQLMFHRDGEWQELQTLT